MDATGEAEAGEALEGEVVVPRGVQVDLEEELDVQRRLLKVTQGQLANAMKAGEDVDPSKIDALTKATVRLANLEQYFRLRELTRHG